MEFYYAEHPTWSMQHWRELDGSKYTLSRHLYKDRFLPYYEHSEYTKFGILDLLHMKTKKFLIQQNTEPISSRDSPYCSFRLFMGKVMLIDFHTVIAEICDIFNELTEFIVLHLDYENATATFKFPIQLNGDTGHSYPCWTKTLTDSFECIFEQGRNMRHRHFAYYKISYLNDGDLEQKFIQQIDYPKEFFINGVVNNNVYGFWAEDWEKSDLSNLVQFCVETKEQKTLKLSGWPTDLKYNYYGGLCRTRWIDRSLVVIGVSDDRKAHLFVMHLDSLQWRKMDIQQLFGRITYHRFFSNYENTLIMETSSYRSDVRRYYRFNFNRPDTLVNLSRYAIKQDSPILQDAVEHLLNQIKRPFTE